MNVLTEKDPEIHFHKRPQNADCLLLSLMTLTLLFRVVVVVVVAVGGCLLFVC